MGIIERIAGTLDGLAGDGDGAAREEIALALAMAERGDVAVAEARLVDVAARFPKLGAAFFHLGRLRARRGALEDAVTAFGKAVDLDRDVAEAWAALGDALARLGRTEPARDALRHALSLATSPDLRGRAHAALGRVHAEAGQLAKAVRDFRKALELLGDDAEVALAYGRGPARLGEPEGDEWLTRAGAAAGRAARALRRGRRGDDRRGPRRGSCCGRASRARPATAACRRRSRGTSRARAAPTRRSPSRSRAWARTRARGRALAALREAYAAAARWPEALAVARRRPSWAAPPARPRRALALALAAHDREALARPRGGRAGPAARKPRCPRQALRAFLARTATDDQLVALARVAPDEAARRFVVAADAPVPPPGASLVGLLGWAHAVAARTPALVSLSPGAGRALEAFDRPLVVAVMGEFNAGKSSFVNALVGEEIAPTGVTPTTATVNVLRHAEAPGARVLYHDGTTRELGAASVSPFLRELDDAQAARVRVVEIFHPLETLRRVEIVDTPGLNSIRPEHEKVARDFLVEADALVWVFAIGQAAKASEKEALALARAAGKHVLGVLNKIDGASEDDVRDVVRHVRGGVGSLVDEVVPFSAKRALAARRAGRTDDTAQALEAALERHFFGRARALKRETALAALQRFVVAARAAAPRSRPRSTSPRGARPSTPSTSACAARSRASAIALRARIDEAYRVAAFEVRDFVRPRAWLFGEHRADSGDEAFLVELLEDAVERATEATRAAMRDALAPVAPTPPCLGEAVARTAAARAARRHGRARDRRGHRAVRRLRPRRRRGRRRRRVLPRRPAAHRARRVRDPKRARAPRARSRARALRRRSRTISPTSFAARTPRSTTRRPTPASDACSSRSTSSGRSRPSRVPSSRWPRPSSERRNEQG